MRRARPATLRAHRAALHTGAPLFPHYPLCLRPRRTALALTIVGCFATFAQAQLAPNALPTGGQVVAGQAAIGAVQNNRLDITQGSQRAAIDWLTFNIGSAAQVNFSQPNASAVALNRVLAGGASEIAGRLTANGQVFLVNPAGVLFSRTASVDVGGLVAATLDIRNDDFMAGRLRFAGAGGAVTNQGRITAAAGGAVALLGGQVTNEGVITATLGTALLAAGDKVTLTFDNGVPLGYSIEQGTLNALVENKQLIQADGGQVVMSAKAADALSTAVVNNTGVIEARTLQNRGGVIKLLSDTQVGQVNVGGVLDASAPNGGDGGFIETSAASVKVTDGAIITTVAAQGATGTWLIDPTDYNIAASGGNITGAALSTNLGSTNVTILSSDSTTGTNGDVNVNDAVSWSANNTLTLSAYRNVNVNSNITATGDTAGLTLTPSNTGAGGSYYLNNGAVITLSGSAPSLTIAGNAYTVINEANGGVTTLQNMSSGLSGRYALGSNIDAAATSGWNAGLGFAPVGDDSTNFTGTFDGLNHTIAGLTINRLSTNYVGLFGYTNGATISNVGLLGGNVSGSDYLGGLVGYNGGGASITNSYNTGSVTGTLEVGGLVGVNGLLGGSSASSITNSYSTGSVTGSAHRTGGLVGGNWGGTISNSYATGSVNGGTWEAGGLVGGNRGTITDSYSTGSVYGGLSAGGLAGFSGSGGTITNSYSTGSVTAGDWRVGGLVGDNWGPITNSYWDTETSGKSNGVNGENGLSIAGSTGLTTAQMMQSGNLTGFDFTNTWWLSAGNTRPFLRSEYSTTITNAHQLQLMAMNLGASYTLGANINMAELSQASGLWNTTTGFAPVGDAATTNFTGVFDGLGHTITGLTINRPTTTNFVGLFGSTNGAAIRNVGLVGGSVSGNVYVGGLVGHNYLGTISNSYNAGTVSGTGNEVGGLVGYNSGAIDNSYSTGNVTAGAVNAIGGLVGNDDGSITNSYSTGNVIGNVYVGGLAGIQRYGPITNSYSTGAVSGNGNVGGLVGLMYDGGASINSYWDTTTSLQATSAGGTPKTTAQMKQLATFSSWNTATPNTIANTGGSEAVWRIYEGHTAPLLTSFLTPLTLTGAPDVSVTYNGAAQSGGAFTLIANVLGAAATGTNAGFYNGYYSTQQGYDITGGNLTITAAALNAISLSGTRAYDGTVDVAANIFTLSGLVGDQTLNLSGVGTVADKNVGTNKPVTLGSLALGDGTGLASNYTFTGGTQTATINPAALTVTADNKSKVYDNADPALTYRITSGSLLGTESLSGALARAAGESVLGGPYAISQGTLANANYGITYSGAGLTITPRPITITADAKSRLSFSANPPFTVTSSGYAPGEGIEELGGTMLFTTTATTFSPAGTYPIVAGGLSSPDYTITYVDGVLTVRQAGLPSGGEAAIASLLQRAVLIPDARGVQPFSIVGGGVRLPEGLE